MELIIKDIPSEGDLKLFIELAKRMGLKAARLTEEEKEDIALSEAIRSARKSGYVAEREKTIP